MVETLDFKKRKKLSLKLIVLMLFSVMLMIIPFFRGAFFTREIIIVEFLTGIFILSWAVIKFLNSEDFKFNTFLAPVVLCMLVVYILPLIFGQAVNKYNAFDYIMRQATCIGAFIIFSDIVKDRRSFFIVLNILSITGVVGAFLAVDSALGNNINIALGFEGTGIIEEAVKRVYGFMQYGNASGAFFALTIFMLLALSFIAENKILRAVYSSLEMPVFLALILVLSRGATFVFIIAYIMLFFIIYGKNNKVRLILNTIVPILMTLIFITTIYSSIEAVLAGDTAKRLSGFYIVLGALALSFAFNIMIQKCQTFLENISDKTYKSLFIVIIAAAVIGVIILFATGLYKSVLPETIVERFTLTGTISDKTAGRTDIYEDGLRAIKDHWLIGAGGGSWNSIYRIYQRTLYDSADAHNYLLQIWLDTGIIGFLVFFAFCLLLLWTVIKNRKEGVLSSFAGVASFMLVGHAIIDFDFSYISLMLLFYSFCGMIDGLCKKEEKMHIFKKKMFGCAWVVLSVFILFNSTNAFTARNNAVKASNIILKNNNAMTVENFVDAVNLMNSAVNTDKWNSTYIISERGIDKDISFTLDDICTMAENTLFPSDVVSKDVKDHIAMVHYTAINKALELDKYNPIVSVKAAAFYFSQAGEIEKSLELVENGIKFNPMGPARYEEVATLYYSAAQYYKSVGENEKAKQALERILTIQDELALWNATEAKEEVYLKEETMKIINDAKEMIKSFE